MHKTEHRVFLGGTANGSKWREKLIPLLKVPFYNPVVPDWTPQDYENELHQRAVCAFLLYVLTPASKSMYSIAEVVDDSNKRPERTIFCFLTEEENSESAYTPHELKALNAIGKLIKANGSVWLKNLEEVAEYINSKALVH
jgi:hypothetical protein